MDQGITLEREPTGRHFEESIGAPLPKPFERARLRQLAISLMLTHPDLTNNILCYLKEASSGACPLPQRTNMTRLMAKKVCQAIKKGRRLLLDRLSDEDTYHAVFVSPRYNFDRSVDVMTSWEAGKLIESTNHLRAVEKYMSLEVEFGSYGNGAYEHCIPRGWLHGLCFLGRLSRVYFCLGPRFSRNSYSRRA